MAKLNVSRTAHGNVKIVLDPTSANKLWTILAHSNFIDSDEKVATEQNKACELFSAQMCRAFIAAGLEWKDPRWEVLN